MNMHRLVEIYKQLCNESDPIRLAALEAAALKSAADALKEQAMISGAMKDEVQVVGRYRRNGRFGSSLQPFLR